VLSFFLNNAFFGYNTITKEFISKDTFKHPPLNPLPSREGLFLSPLSLEGRGQG
jgi:hypothetical protein